MKLTNEIKSYMMARIDDEIFVPIQSSMIRDLGNRTAKYMIDDLGYIEASRVPAWLEDRVIYTKKVLLTDIKDSLGYSIKVSLTPNLIDSKSCGRNQLTIDRDPKLYKSSEVTSFGYFIKYKTEFFESLSKLFDSCLTTVDLEKECPEIAKFFPKNDIKEGLDAPRLPSEGLQLIKDTLDGTMKWNKHR